MKRFIFSTLALAGVSSAFAVMAQDGDLVLPGARYPAKFLQFDCGDFAGAAVDAPAGIASRDLRFDDLVGDGGLNRFLVTANYGACRYSAILDRDRSAVVARVGESQVRALETEAACDEGKAFLDALLQEVPYEATPNGHQLVALHVKAEDAAQLCDGGKLRAVFKRVPRAS